MNKSAKGNEGLSPKKKSKQKLAFLFLLVSAGIQSPFGDADFVGNAPAPRDGEYITEKPTQQAVIFLRKSLQNK